MPKIEIKKLADFPQARFEVTVMSNSVTKHTITLTQEYYQKLTAGAVSAEELIQKSFEFLLARESNTSILSEFNLAVIFRYFPAYEQEMKNKFRSS